DLHDLYQDERRVYPNDSAFTVTAVLAGKGVASQRAPHLECPSDPRAGELYPAPFATTNHGIYATTNYFGVIGTTDTANDGMLFNHSVIRANDVLDGLSHTIIVGERPNIFDLILGWWACGSGIPSSSGA